MTLIRKNRKIIITSISAVCVFFFPKKSPKSWENKLLKVLGGSKKFLRVIDLGQSLKFYKSGN